MWSVVYSWPLVETSGYKMIDVFDVFPKKIIKSQLFEGFGNWKIFGFVGNVACKLTVLMTEDTPSLNLPSSINRQHRRILYLRHHKMTLYPAYVFQRCQFFLHKSLIIIHIVYHYF